jgi:hypothetical protein
LSYLSRCEPLRAGICGVSGRNKGSAGSKIFFSDLSNLSWTEELKVSLFKIKFIISQNFIVKLIYKYIGHTVC